MSTLLQTKSSGPDSYHLGEHSVLDIAKEYVSLGERPIPLCDPRHAFVSVAHVDGYRRSDGNLVPPCGSPGKAPLERSYPRFATELPTQADLFRMFNSHGGNIGGVVPEGRIVIDIDPRNGGLDSINAYVNQHGPLPWTPTVLTGGAGVHYYFLLPPGVARPKGGSLKSSGFPGVEWKGPGAQVVLPPSVHSSGEAYQWEPGGSLEDLPVALIPEPLLCLILSNARSSPSRSTSEPPPGDQNQPADLQRYFATLWQSVSVEIQGNIGDLFCVCPFHKDRNPSLHIDSQRCIWYCFSPGCKAFEGGGVHLLESLLGPIEGEHRFVRPSVLGKDSYPNDDAHFSNDVTYDLKARAGQLFPVPKELPPQVVVRLYAFREDPSRAVRHQVISNLWINPANRAIKRRMMWANLMKEIVRSPNHDALELYEEVVPCAEWTDKKRESMAAKVRRRKGEYACFDNRSAAGVVRFLTNVAIPGASRVEDMETTLFEVIRDVDLPEEGDRKQRVHLVWLSKGWALASHESKGVLKLIAFKKNVEPVDDAQELEEAQKQGLESWTGKEHRLDEWVRPRYFAVPHERVAAAGTEAALRDLLTFATALGYQQAGDPCARLFGHTRGTPQ